MNVVYDKELPESMETYFEQFVLPKFGMTSDVKWERHVRTDPDNFLHIFTHRSIKYALAFDDYPSGFSVDGEPFVKAVHIKEADKILHVAGQNNIYRESFTGAFMLFQILDEQKFNTHLDYLEIEYENFSSGWDDPSRPFVVVARDILQIAEVASENHDSTMLFALHNLVETFVELGVSDNNLDITTLDEYVDVLIDAEFGYEKYDQEYRDKLSEIVYSELARESQLAVTKSRYSADNLGQMITLVTATYARQQSDMTTGASIALVVDDDKIEYPRQHFLDDELKTYFADNPYITSSNIEYDMPEELGDFRLVKDSVTTNVIFRRELEYVSF